MFVSRVILKNWRNFRSVDVAMGQRVFLVGPNACGKSNFLDVFRFLQDIVKPGGGLQSAVNRRGGLSKIRWVCPTFCTRCRVIYDKYFLISKCYVSLSVS